MAAVLPVLYSFRRCPYAMRARLALRVSGVVYDCQEVVLKDKPARMLALSPKGTVPVLWLPHEGRVLDESLDIMRWALAQHDPEGWLPATDVDAAIAAQRIATNDGDFKYHLDRYKYPQRFGLSDGSPHRDQAALILQDLARCLQTQPYLSGPRWGLQDACLAPFVRQFAHTQPAWFAQQPWPALAAWLQHFEGSAAFLDVMKKPAA
jgi:glutathione S-transferase